MEFYIIHCSINDIQYTRDELIHKINVHSGKIVLNYHKNAIAISSNHNNHWLSTFQQKYQVDILHISWIIDCINNQKLIIPIPNHFIYISNKSQQKFNNEIDQYGDYYLIPNTIINLKQIFNHITLPDIKIQQQQQQQIIFI